MHVPVFYLRLLLFDEDDPDPEDLDTGREEELLPDDIPDLLPE